MTIYGSRMVPRAIEGEEEGLANPKRRKTETAAGKGVRSQESGVRRYLHGMECDRCGLARTVRARSSSIHCRDDRSGPGPPGWARSNYRVVLTYLQEGASPLQGVALVCR